MKKTYLFIILVLAVLVIGIFFIMSVIKTPTAHIAKEPILEKISIGDNFIPASAPLAVAHYKGYFEDEGLDVTIERFAAGKFSFDAVLTGDVDIADVAETPLMFYRFQENDVYVVGTMATFDKGVKIVARIDHGISSPKDLKNKKIGIIQGTISEFYINMFLAENGINISEVELINIKPPEMITAIARGDIDAFAVWEPFIYKAQKELGDNTIVFIDEKIYTGTWNFAIRKEFAQGNPDKLKKFLRAISRAEELIINNKEEAILITANYTGLNKEILRDIWGDFDFELVFDDKLQEYLEKEADWAIEKGLVQEEAEIPDYTSMIYPDLLKEVKPEAVRIS